MISVGIVGASGFTGEELVKLLLKHPDVSLDVLTSRTHAGKKVSDCIKLDTDFDKKFIEPSVDNLSHCDVVFFASPNGVAMDMARESPTSSSRKVLDMARARTSRRAASQQGSTSEVTAVTAGNGVTRNHSARAGLRRRVLDRWL